MRAGLAVTGFVLTCVSLVLSVVATFTPAWSVGSRLNGDRGLIHICQDQSSDCVLNTDDRPPLDVATLVFMILSWVLLVGSVAWNSYAFAVKEYAHIRYASIMTLAAGVLGLVAAILYTVRGFALKAVGYEFGWSFVIAWIAAILGLVAAVLSFLGGSKDRSWELSEGTHL